MCCAISITCTFGSPTTMLLSNEIAEGVGTSEVEIKALRNYIMPKMTVAGFVMVTISSVALGGLIVSFLK